MHHAVVTLYAEPLYMSMYGWYLSILKMLVAFDASPVMGVLGVFAMPRSVHTNPT